MSISGLSRRCLSVALAAALVVTLIPSTVGAGEALGDLNGRVFSAETRSPMEGAVVKAAHLETEQVFESARTSENGKFELADLPVGTYELAVGTEDGLYPTGQRLTVEKGRTQTLALALAPGQDEEEDDDDKKGGFWDKPLVASLTIVGVAVVLALAADSLLGDSDDPQEIVGSPDAPE